MNLFEIIYRWFVSIYGHDLADHLSGYDCQEESFIGNNQYIPLGFIALSIALVIMVVYYYVINSATINKWWHWVIVMLIVGLINLFIGYAWVSNEIPNIGDCLMFIDGDKDKNPNYLISEANAWLFGLANFLVASLFFIVFTFSFKWWSTQGKRTPF